MRVSAVLAAAMSALVMAAPVDKRAYVTDIVVVYEYVTVTAGQPLPTKYRQQNKQQGSRPKRPSSVIAPPVVVVTPTPSPSPPPAVVVPVVSSTPPPAPVVVTSAAPVVVVPASSAAPSPSPAPVIVDEVEETPSAGAPAAGDYKAAVLFSHNIHRANHSAPDLAFSDELASYAQTVAAKCVWGHDLTPGGGNYGQNIAMTGTSSSGESAKDPSVLVTGVVSNMWYNGELHLFPASSYGQASPDMSNFSGWGHFSQVVWKGTTQVGCATHYCSTGTPMFPSRTSGWYTVCNYRQAGNMGGAYGANVLKPLGHATYAPIMP